MGDSRNYNEFTGSGMHVKTYASLSATDLIAEGGKACRVIEVMGPDAGTIQIKNLRGQTVELPKAAGDKSWVVQATELVGGTAKNVVVTW